jgi:transcriptional regulator GlxA family with amidase domain
MQNLNLEAWRHLKIKEATNQTQLKNRKSKKPTASIDGERLNQAFQLLQSSTNQINQIKTNINFIAFKLCVCM